MKKLALCLALVIGLGTLVFAQVRNPMQTQLDAFIAETAKTGTFITYSTVETGADLSLTVRDLVILSDEGKNRVTMPWIIAKPIITAPDRVLFTVAPEVLLTVSVNNRPGAAEEATPYNLLIRSDDLNLTAALAPDSAGKLTHDLAARSVQVTSLDKGHPVLKRLDITQRDVSLHISGFKDGNAFEGSLSIASLVMDYAIHLAEMEQTNDAKGTLADIAFSFSATGLGFDSFEEFLGNGGLIDIAMRTGKSDLASNTTGGPMPLALNGTADSSSFEFSIRNGAFSYLGDTTNMAYQVTPDATVLPIPPFALSMALARMRIDVPVAPSDLPRDALFDLALQELVVDDALWAMIDPAASIPRDPANLDVGLTAKVQVSPPATASSPKTATKGSGTEADETSNPFEFAKILSLDIDRANFMAAGVALDAKGALSFDNSGPIPLPLGTVDVNLAGAHALSAKLLALGLIDKLQAGMAMGMIAAFAVPGDVPDSYISKVEFRPDGIFANGAPVN